MNKLNNYASMFEALCRNPTFKDSKPSQISAIAMELVRNGYIVDHDGDIIDLEGNVYWPDDNGKTGSIGVGDEPANW